MRCPLYREIVMCFSAKASFIASGTLTVMGLLCVYRAKKNKALLPFACTPLIFAIQQFCEGLVWIGLTKELTQYPFYTIGMYGFVFFAGIWWPSWSPFTLYILEHQYARKRILFITLIIGVFTSVVYLISLITQPLTVLIINHHLYYPTLSYPFNSVNSLAQSIETYLTAPYFIATIVPCFVIRISGMWLLGVVMGIGSLTGYVFYYPTTASTWCFFAAISSMLIYGIIYIQSQKSDKKN